MSTEHLSQLIGEAFDDRSLMQQQAYQQAVLDTLELLDQGKIRVATRNGPGNWTTHAWVKQAVLLYFGVAKMAKLSVGPFEFYDKIPLKRDLDTAGVRVVPPGTVRYGSFIE